MRIEIEIPDWAKTGNLFVLDAFGQVLARKVGESWEVKTQPCAKCGYCCRKLKPPPICDDGTGKPKYLVEVNVNGKKEYHCSLRGQKPLDCVLACPSDIGFEECQMRFRKVKQQDGS